MSRSVQGDRVVLGVVLVVVTAVALVMIGTALAIRHAPLPVLRCVVGDDGRYECRVER